MVEIDKALKEKADKRMKDGWIRSTVMIEVLASSESAARSALEKHVEKLSKEDKTIVYMRDYKEIQKVDNPTPRIKEAFSNVVELEMVNETYEKLVYISMIYGPSSIEILEPDILRVDAGDAQNILNSVADIIHRFAAAGVGGLVVNT